MLNFSNELLTFLHIYFIFFKRSLIEFNTNPNIIVPGYMIGLNG